MNSGSCKISISSCMYDLSIYRGCVLVLTWVSCSIKVLLKGRVIIIRWFVLWFAWITIHIRFRTCSSLRGELQVPLSIY